MNFKLDDLVVKLVKQVAGSSPLKGRERPGHKYLRRIPLSAGGYKYIYKEPDGTEREDVVTRKEARKQHPDDFDKSKSKFSVQDEYAKEILGFSDAIDKKYLKHISKRFLDSTQYAGAAGEFKESMIPLAIAIGEGYLYNLDDGVVFAQQEWEKLKGSTDRYDLETSRKISQFLTSVKFLKDANTEQFNGSKIIETTWYGSGFLWKEWKNSVEKKTGREIDANKFRLIPVGEEQGQHIVADALLEKIDDEGKRTFVAGFSAKVNAGSEKPVSLKSGTWITNVATWAKNFGDENLHEFGIGIEKIHDEVKQLSKSKNWTNEQRIRVLSGRMNEFMANQFGITTTKQSQKQKDMSSAYARMMIDRFHRFHDDHRAKDVFISMTSINRDDTVDFYQTKGSDMKKLVNDWLEKGPISIRMKRGNRYKAADGKSYLTYNPVELIGGPLDDRQTFLIQENRWSNRDKVQIRTPFKFIRSIFSAADKNDERSGASTKLIDDMDGFKIPSKVTIKSIGVSRPNHKYIRKIVTESGNVRYIYREPDVKEKKPDEQQNFQAFMSKIDSSNPEFSALFESALKEIDDASFQNINAGTSAVRFTSDVEMFLNFLDVSEEQRQNKEFNVSTGTFGAVSGRMAFNISNFPSDIPDIIKKRAMLHEVMHAYFFGTLRMKSNKPMTPGEFDSIDKKYMKKSAKFVDAFGKLDKEMRSKISEDDDFETIKEVFIDVYSSKDDFENFAQAGAYYFLMPELLEKKEPKVYSLFNEHFMKYKE
jgi:hypothetical protein